MLVHLLGFAPGKHPAALHTALGWIEWCKGHGSRADQHITLALQADPDHRLANLFAQLLGRGILAGYARNKATAYIRR